VVHAVADADTVKVERSHITHVVRIVPEPGPGHRELASPSARQLRIGAGSATGRRS
jgi:hypothetical protein